MNRAQLSLRYLLCAGIIITALSIWNIERDYIPNHLLQREEIYYTDLFAITSNMRSEDSYTKSSAHKSAILRDFTTAAVPSEINEFPISTGNGSMKPPLAVDTLTSRNGKQLTSLASGGPSRKGSPSIVHITPVSRVSMLPNDTDPTQHSAQSFASTTMDLSSAHNMNLTNITNNKGSCSCQFIKIKEAKVQNNTFRRIANTTYVYSAYFDNRWNHSAYVTVIAMSSLEIQLFCHIWSDSEQQLPWIVPAYVQLIDRPNDGHSTIHDVTIDCQIPKHEVMTRTPLRIMLANTSCCVEVADPVVLLIDNIHQHQLQHNFSVCLHKALISYEDEDQLVEWFEVYRVLGAEHFLVYNYTGHNRLLPYIKYYNSSDYVDVFSWSVEPFDFDHLINCYKGQLALSMDCTYKSMYRTRYLALVDADEIIVPHRHRTIMQLLDQGPCNGFPTILFRNAFFSIRQQPDPWYNRSLLPQEILSFKYTTRQNFTFPCHIRSKMVVVPHRVHRVSVHQLSNIAASHAFGEPMLQCCMDPTHGYLHHYRDWDESVQNSIAWLRGFGHNSASFSPSMSNNIITRRLYDFQSDIIRNINFVHKQSNKFRK